MLLKGGRRVCTAEIAVVAVDLTWGHASNLDLREHGAVAATSRRSMVTMRSVVHRLLEALLE